MLPGNRVAEFAASITERRIAVLFENPEAYDIQETRRISREEKRKIRNLQKQG